MRSQAHDRRVGRCASCGDHNPPVRPSRVRWAVFPLIWTPLLALGVCSALLLPANLILVPCWLACASAVGPLARRLLDPTCGACGESRGSAQLPVATSIARAPRTTEAAAAARMTGS